MYLHLYLYLYLYVSAEECVALRRVALKGLDMLLRTRSEGRRHALKDTLLRA